jgi:hypothetical protein
MIEFHLFFSAVRLFSTCTMFVIPHILLLVGMVMQVVAVSGIAVW